MNKEIKEVKDNFQEHLSMALSLSVECAEVCIICGNVISERDRLHAYTTSDYIADASKIGITEFTEFAENEIGSGYGFVYLHKQCFNNISQDVVRYNNNVVYIEDYLKRRNK